MLSTVCPLSNCTTSLDYLCNDLIYYIYSITLLFIYICLFQLNGMSHLAYILLWRTLFDFHIYQYRTSQVKSQQQPTVSSAQVAESPLHTYLPSTCLRRGNKPKHSIIVWIFSVGSLVSQHRKWNSLCTCVVILSAVAQILLLFKHKLWEGEIISHLNGVVRQPLKDQVIHGVTNCEKRAEEIKRGYLNEKDAVRSVLSFHSINSPVVLLRISRII